MEQKKFQIHESSPCRLKSGAITKSTPELFNCASSTPEKYRCDVCGYGVNLKVNLRGHVWVVHEKRGFTGTLANLLQCYRCKICTFQTHSALVLFKHDVDCGSIYRKKTPKSLDAQWYKYLSQLYCKRCSYKTTHRICIRRHILRNHTLPKFVASFKCEKCPHKATSREDLQRHVVAKHPYVRVDVELVRCVRCSLNFEAADYERHLHVDHNFQRPLSWFWCEYCSYRTIRRAQLTIHRMWKHVDQIQPIWVNCKQSY